MPTSPATDADDIARVLLSLAGEEPASGVEQALKRILSTHVSTDRKKITRRLDVVTDKTFAISLEKGAKIFLGGGGVVLQATNAKVPALKYGLKVQRPSLALQRDAIKESERAVAEYTYHAPLSHENIARLFTAWTTRVLTSQRGRLPSYAPSPVFMMEWIDGAAKFGDYLRARCAATSESGRALNALHFCETIKDAFAALAHLHDQNLIHWDIKGDNLLVDKFGRVKLMDIGNARWKDGKQPSTGSKKPDLIALTTYRHYPSILNDCELPRPKANSSKRTALKLDSTKWDSPWLDMWMLAREIALLVGLSDYTDQLPLSMMKLPKELRDGSPNFIDAAFPSSDLASIYMLKCVRLILRRLLFPESVNQPKYYETAREVVTDLLKLAPEFGAAQETPELRSIPRNVLRVPVDGNIALPVRLRALISSNPIARLKRHLQVGMLSEVYPGATHKRFEHTLGVFFTTCQYVRALYSDRTNVFWRISLEAREIDALLLAALLHDIGHLAYGHFLEEMEGIFRSGAHEQYVQCVLRKDQRFRDAATLYGPSATLDRKRLVKLLGQHWSMTRAELDDFLEFVADILKGVIRKNVGGVTTVAAALNDLRAAPIFSREAELQRGATAQLKLEILHSIIDSAIDADKLDYLRRDGLHAGVAYSQGIDIDRFLQSLTTLHHIDVKSRLFHSIERDIKRTPSDIPQLHACIAVTEKGRLPVESVLFARYQMFQSVYWHHTARSHTAVLQFCVQELLAASNPSVDSALRSLIDEFRTATDDRALLWLQSRLRMLKIPARSVLLSACSALLGDRENVYKECFLLRYRGYEDQLKPGEVEQVYQSLMSVSRSIQQSQSLGEYLTSSQSFRRGFTKELQKKLGGKISISDGEILIDIPPAGRDQVRNIFVMEHGEAHPIEEMSSMARAVSDAFQYWTRHFRVFCAPNLLERCVRSGITRNDLSKHCWEILRARYVPELEQRSFAGMDGI